MPTWILAAVGHRTLILYHTCPSRLTRAVSRFFFSNRTIYLALASGILVDFNFCNHPSIKTFIECYQKDTSSIGLYVKCTPFMLL